MVTFGITLLTSMIIHRIRCFVGKPNELNESKLCTSDQFFFCVILRVNAMAPAHKMLCGERINLC